MMSCIFLIIAAFIDISVTCNKLNISAVLLNLLQLSQTGPNYNYISMSRNKYNNFFAFRFWKIIFKFTFWRFSFFLSPFFYFISLPLSFHIILQSISVLYTLSSYLASFPHIGHIGSCLSFQYFFSIPHMNLAITLISLFTFSFFFFGIRKFLLCLSLFTRFYRCTLILLYLLIFLASLFVLTVPLIRFVSSISFFFYFCTEYPLLSQYFFFAFVFSLSFLSLFFFQRVCSILHSYLCLILIIHKIKKSYIYENYNIQ